MDPGVCGALESSARTVAAFGVLAPAFPAGNALQLPSDQQDSDCSGR